MYSALSWSKIGAMSSEVASWSVNFLFDGDADALLFVAFGDDVTELHRVHCAIVVGERAGTGGRSEKAGRHGDGKTCGQRHFKATGILVTDCEAKHREILLLRLVLEPSQIVGRGENSSEVSNAC